MTVKIASEMAMAHNVMVRNLNSIYLQAANIHLPADIRDFIIFCQTVRETIHHHHSAEELVFFPAVAAYTGDENIMGVNLEQHKAFETGLEEFGEYVKTVKPEEFDGMKLKSIIEGFGEALSIHLTEEIPTLLALDKFGDAKLQIAWDGLAREARNSIVDKA